MKHITTLLLYACCLSLIPLNAAAIQYSKLSIVLAAKQIGKWQQMKSFIESNGLTDEWQSCQYISDDFPQYPAMTNAIVQAGLMSSQEIVALLAVAQDTALPDNLLKSAYTRNMSNESGRVFWHGKVTNTQIDTNRLVTVYTYEDGYVHEMKFDVAVPPSLRAQLTAADRKAKSDALKAKKKAEEAARIQARIDLLTTNMSAEVSALMAKKRWPEELARVYLQTELNKLQTNDVSMTFGPGRRP